MTLFLGPTQQTKIDMQVRALMVNGNIREFTTGEPHDVTERTFVVQRAYRVNDALPDEPKKVPKWKWQRGGWLSVDRNSGRVTQLRLPEFDPYFSTAAWYRDMSAYCGVSPDGERLFAVVAQLTVKKPILRQSLGPIKPGEMPDAQCAAPKWERNPARVTFYPVGGQPLSFAIKSQSAEVIETDAPADAPAEPEEPK